MYTIKSLVNLTLLTLIVLLCNGCSTIKSSANEAPTCDSMRDTNLVYVGKYLGYENKQSFVDVSRDFYCAEKFKYDNKLERGYVTIMGGTKFPGDDVSEASDCSKIVGVGADKASEEKDRDAKIKKCNMEKTYFLVRDFAKNWTKEHGKEYPIMTGAGPGIMAAGSRGATEAIENLEDKEGYKSIGYTTYYTPMPKAGEKLNPTCGNGPKCADATLALHKYKEKSIHTHGFVFTSVAARESLMIKHSAAIIFAPGGTGTEWELSQTIETIKSEQLAPIPLILVGDEQYWVSYLTNIGVMKKNGFVKPGDINIEIDEKNGSTGKVVENEACVGYTSAVWVKNTPEYKARYKAECSMANITLVNDSQTAFRILNNYFYSSN